MTDDRNYLNYSPKAMKLLWHQNSLLKKLFLQDENLTIEMLYLVKVKVAQLHQCYFSVNLHSEEALRKGEKAERLRGLNIWRDMPFYTEYEQVALEWAEHLCEGREFREGLYESFVKEIGEVSMVNLTLAINAIKTWIRISKERITYDDYLALRSNPKIDFSYL